MPKYPDIEVQLTGEDGNAFAVLGRVTKALRRGGVGQMDRDLFTQEAMAGDYDNLLRVVSDWVTVL